VDRTDARGFAADFRRSYREKTSLGTLCTREAYDSGDADFFQIGRRVSVPASLVGEGRYRYVSDDVVGALCEGEKAFVVGGLGGLADDGRIPTVDGGRSPLASASDVVEEPSAVLLPRDEDGDRTVEAWEDEGRVSRLGDGAYVETDDGLGVWLHRHDGEGAYVVDAGRVSVTQKSADETETPSFAVEEYEGGDDGRLSVHFGEVCDGYVDVAYRVVVSKPVVEDGGACRLRL